MIDVNGKYYVYINECTVTDGLGGDVTISGGVTYDPGTQTLTCISTGGPATTVSWTRDSTNITEGNETVLNDPVTAQYTHTLTVTTAGEYTCTVANNKPSNDSASIIIIIAGIYSYSVAISIGILCLDGSFDKWKIISWK